MRFFIFKGRSIVYNAIYPNISGVYFRRGDGMPMPGPASSFSSYRNNIVNRSGTQRSDAVERHLDLLTGMTSSLQTDFLNRLGQQTRRYQNSSGYQRILTSLETINRMMDETVTAETEPLVREPLIETYAALIQQCDEYLASHSGRRYTSVGKARVALIQELRSKADDEAQLLVERLSEVRSFANGITLRQLFAGMRPLQAPTLQPTQFSLPKASIQDAPDAAAPEQADADEAVETVPSADHMKNIRLLRQSLQTDVDLDSNRKAILDIMLEQLDRANQRGETVLCGDLLDRVIALCRDGNDSPVLNALAQACTDFKSSQGLTGSDVTVTHRTYSREVPTPSRDGDNGTGGINPDVNLAFPEYHHLNPDVVRYMAQKLSFNDGKKAHQLYGADMSGTTVDWGQKHGYIQTSHSSAINTYLRNHANATLHPSQANPAPAPLPFSSLRTIGLLDQAAASTYLPQKTRLHRMLTGDYLSSVLGIDGVATGHIPGQAVKAVNDRAGTILTDQNFMCTGFVMDIAFGSLPIMLTLLCDEGTPVYPTRNLAEGEIILGRGTSYMILSAVMHTPNNFLTVPGSHLRFNNQYVEGKESAFQVGVLEIFAKVLTSGPPQTTLSQSAERFQAFQQKQSAYVPAFQGDHGDYVHRNAYLDMARTDQASLTEQEAAAMDEYTNDSGAINSRLRSGQVPGDVTDFQNSAIKQAFAKHPIPVDMETYRGVSDGFLTYLLNSNPNFDDEARANALTPDKKINHDWMDMDDHFKMFEGVVFQDAAFLSTTTNKPFARRWANNVVHDEITRAQNKTVDLSDPARGEDIAGAHVLTMHLPAGTRAMFTDTMYLRRGGRPRGQDEVTLDAGYTYYIERVDKVAPGRYEMHVSCVL